MTDLSIDDMEMLFDMMEEKKLEGKNDNDVICSCGIENHEQGDGSLVCTKCGLELESNIIDKSAEWNSYTNDDSGNSGFTSRCDTMNNDLLDSNGLFSNIQLNKWDRNKYSLFKLQRTQQYTSKDRSLLKVYNKIDYNCLRNGIVPCIIQDTKALYKYISYCKLSRGAVREAIIASCLYYIFYHYNVPRSVNEVSKIFEMDEKKITKSNKLISTYLWDSPLWKPILYKVSNPIDYVIRFTSQLDLDKSLLNKVRLLCDKINISMIFVGKDASYTAAVSIYHNILSEKLDIPKEDICNVCNISTVTLNKLHRRLVENKVIAVS